MERTVGTLVLLLAVAGLAAGAPQSLFGLFRGNQGGGRRPGLFGSIINSTADALLQPLNLLGGAGHNKGTTGPNSGHGSGTTSPAGQHNSDTSTHKPTTQVKPLGTTQNSVDPAIDEIFGNSGPGTTAGPEKGSTPSKAGDQGSHQGGSGPEQNTPTDVDLAFQQLFGGDGHGGDKGKPTSTENPSSSGSNNPASHEKESGDSSSSKPGNDEHKQSTPSSVDSAIQDVFGGANSEKETSSSKPTTDTDTGSGGKDSTKSPVDLAILDVFGSETKSDESSSKSR